MSDLDEATLDALMARLAQGERAAFDPLFRALEARARRLARARVDAASASDVAQSALLKVFARAHEFTPGRFGEPEEVAMTAVFLASDEALFINAETITIDGGRSVLYHD